jgi:hypothetical protein
VYLAKGARALLRVPLARAFEAEESGLMRGRPRVVGPVPVAVAADDPKRLLSQNVLVLTKLDGEHVNSLPECFERPW